jgi:hypothetical protein
MPKNFPYLRLFGNQDAAVRHVRRGMAELFRAEELWDKMGVPISKRTVEVSEHTSITVYRSRGQTFIDIHSNPPVLPEIVPPPEEKEFPERYACPSAFLIRSFESTFGVGAYDTDGYIIAYNHQTKRWEKARFSSESGNTVPEAGNIGWYHANDERRTGLYDHCDVITWKGQNAPDLMPLTVAGHDNGEQKTKFTSPNVYFQGRKFSTPYDVLGACILEAADDDGELHDYMYLHLGSFTSASTGTLIEPYKVSDRSYRAKLSDVLSSSGAPTWDLVATASALDFADELNMFAVNQQFLAPRSCGYIDKDGFVYVIREYWINDPHNVVHNHRHGATAFIKYNIRDMTGEVISSTATNSPVLDLTVSSSPYDTNNPGAGPSGITFTEFGDNIFSGFYNIQNLGTPWVFYVFPGTQDLYYLALEHSYNWSSTYGAFIGGEKLYVYSGSGSTDLVVYKNHEEFDRIEFIKLLNSGHLSIDWPQQNEEWSNWECIARTKWIYEYHPEIKGLLNHVQVEIKTENEGPETLTTYTWHRNNEESLLYSEALPGFLSSLNWNGPLIQFWIPPVVMAGFEDGEFLYSDAANRVYEPCTFHNSAAYNGGSELLITAWGIGSAGGLGLGGIFPLQTYVSKVSHPGYGVWNLEAKFGCGNYGEVLSTHWPLRHYGSSQGFVLKGKVDVPGDYQDIWLADSFAIHRSVGASGEKPYLWLRRKLYPSGSTGPLNIVNHTTGNIVTADQDPGLQISEPYYFNQTAFYRKIWWLWTKPSGSLIDLTADPTFTEHHWEDSEWELTSNFTSLGQLNAMTREEGANLFNIGVI